MSLEGMIKLARLLINRGLWAARLCGWMGCGVASFLLAFNHLSVVWLCLPLAAYAASEAVLFVDAYRSSCSRHDQWQRYRDMAEPILLIMGAALVSAFGYWLGDMLGVLNYA